MAQHPDNLYLALGLRSRSTSDRAVVRLPRHDPASRMADPAKQDARVVGIKQYHKGVFKLTNAALDLDSQGEQPTKPPRVPRPPKLRATPARQITLTSHRVHTALAPDIWGTLSHSGKRGQALANYKGALQQIASGLAISCDDKGIYYIRNLIIVVVVVVAIPLDVLAPFPSRTREYVQHRCAASMPVGNGEGGVPSVEQAGHETSRLRCPDLSRLSSTDEVALRHLPHTCGGRALPRPRRLSRPRVGQGAQLEDENAAERGRDQEAGRRARWVPRQ